METIEANDTIGHRLKFLRKHLKVSGEAFCDATGIGKATLRKLETSGSSSPSVELPIRIHNAYGVNISWLLVGKGEMFDNSTNLTEEVRHLKAQLSDKEDTVNALLKVITKLKGELKRVTQAQGDGPDKSTQFLLNLPTPAPTRRTATP